MIKFKEGDKVQYKSHNKYGYRNRAYKYIKPANVEDHHIVEDNHGLLIIHDEDIEYAKTYFKVSIEGVVNENTNWVTVTNVSNESDVDLVSVTKAMGEHKEDDNN